MKKRPDFEPCSFIKEKIKTAKNARAQLIANQTKANSDGNQTHDPSVIPIPDHLKGQIKDANA